MLAGRAVPASDGCRCCCPLIHMLFAGAMTRTAGVLCCVKAALSLCTPLRSFPGLLAALPAHETTLAAASDIVRSHSKGACNVRRLKGRSGSDVWARVVQAAAQGNFVLAIVKLASRAVHAVAVAPAADPGPLEQWLREHSAVALLSAGALEPRGGSTAKAQTPKPVAVVQAGDAQEVTLVPWICPACTLANYADDSLTLQRCGCCDRLRKRKR